MKPKAAQLLEYADKAIEAGRRGLDADDVETAADRACVAMLRLASAALTEDGLAPTSARGICVAYGQRFSGTGRLYSAYHRWLLDSVDLRKAVTGDLPTRIDRQAAATAGERAELFRDAVVRFLERNAM